MCLILLALPGLAGCGEGLDIAAQLQGGRQTRSVLYLAEGAQVERFYLGSDGSLLSQGTITGSGNTSFSLLASADGSFLVTTDPTSSNVVTYALAASTGLMSTSISGTHSTGNTPNSDVAFAPGTEYFYSLAYSGRYINGYQLGANGAITALSGFPVQSGSAFGNGQWLTAHPSKPYLYMAATNDSPTCSKCIRAYSVDGSGKLVETSGSPFTSAGSPVTCAVSPDGQVLFSSDLGANLVYAFTFDGSGNLVASSTPSFGTGSPNYFAFHPTYKYMYLSNYGSGTVSAYSYTDSATTTLLGAYTAAANVGRVLVDPTGKFLYAVVVGTKKIYGYAIGSDGTLSALASSPFQAAGNLGNAATFAQVPL